MTEKIPFSTVVGNESLRKRLGHDVLNGTLPHALILEGPAGTGKHTVARACVAALACHNKKDASLPVPCLVCPSCRKILEGKSPDLITLGTEGKATIGVETVRFLKEDPKSSFSIIWCVE